jgi:hypothetical protein
LNLIKILTNIVHKNVCDFDSKYGSTRTINDRGVGFQDNRKYCRTKAVKIAENIDPNNLRKIATIFGENLSKILFITVRPFFRRKAVKIAGNIDHNNSFKDNSFVDNRQYVRRLSKSPKKLTMSWTPGAEDVGVDSFRVFCGHPFPLLQHFPEPLLLLVVGQDGILC